MAKAEYKGHTATQASNGHVMIFKNNKMVGHISCNPKESKDLTELIKEYIKIRESEG